MTKIQNGTSSVWAVLRIDKQLFYHESTKVLNHEKIK
jgi:hypothetical protein